MAAMRDEIDELMKMKKDLAEKALQAGVVLLDKKRQEKEASHFEALDVMKERLKIKRSMMLVWTKWSL